MSSRMRQPRPVKRVLLVESPSSERDRHTQTLLRNQYEITAADTVEFARDLWRPQNFGLVLVSLNGFGSAAAGLCDEIKERDPRQVIAMIFHPDQELPPTECPTLIFTTEPDEYFLARVETLTAVAHAA